MESLATASEILSQLKQLTDGMAPIRQDVDALKHQSTLQHTPSSAVDDDGAADNSPHTAARPPGKNNNDSSPKTTCHSQSALWSEEMDVRDPLLDDDVPTKESAPIKVVPNASRTNDFQGCQEQIDSPSAANISCCRTTLPELLSWTQ